MKGWELKAHWRRVRSQSISAEICDSQSKIHCKVKVICAQVQVRALTVTHTTKSPRASAGKIELRETCRFRTLLCELLVVTNMFD